MKKAIWFGCLFTMALTASAQAQAPDPQDSIILESKRVATTPAGHSAFALKVYLTNKDSVAILTLALREATASGSVYVPLDSLSGTQPDEADGWTLPDCLTYLKSTLRDFPGEDFSKYNGASPDSFLLSSAFSPTGGDPMRRSEPPNAVRSAIWELEFAGSSNTLGTIELDSCGGFGQSTHFTIVKQHGVIVEDIPVNFQKGIITLDPKPNWAPIGDRFVIAGQPLVFNVAASDPNATIPALTALVPPPSGAGFTDFGNGTGQFSWTPATNQTGVYPVEFIASDGLQADTERVAVSVLGEQVQEQQSGNDPGDEFGAAVSGGGDADLDGAADYIIGAPGSDAPTPAPGEAAALTDAGSIYVYSGATDALIFQKSGEQAGNRLGGTVGLVGDVNNDGRADFIAGAAGSNDSAGAIYVYSGLDGSLLYQKSGASSGDRLGGTVGLVGDMTGDSFDDFVAGAPGTNNSAGAVYVYSGFNGDPLFQKTGGTAGDRLGGAVGISGDVIDFSGDARSDLIVGAEGVNNSTGAAYIYSGADGSLLRTISGGAAGDRLGGAVGFTNPEDVNGDGRADYIIGAPGVSDSAGAVYVYSGADGSVLYQETGAAAGDLLGSSVAISADINGDGSADFIAGALGVNDSAGAVYLYSGGDGSSLFQQTGDSPGNRLGGGVGIFEDADGGSNTILSGAPGVDPSGNLDAGAAYLLPIPTPVVCASTKGDLNGVGGRTPADVVLMLNCVYLTSGNCDLCFADVNCSGGLSPADVVFELQMVYLAVTPPC